MLKTVLLRMLEDFAFSYDPGFLDKRKAGCLSCCKGSPSWACIYIFIGPSPEGLLNGE